MGKFISATLRETVNAKHQVDAESEERREELLRSGEGALPRLPGDILAFEAGREELRDV